MIIKVDGMTCSNCARSVEGAVTSKGGKNVAVYLADKEVVFNLSHDVTLDEVKAAIEDRGYKVLEDIKPKDEKKN